ncbi:MAG: NADH-quinone oxidoreductase subunit C [Actinomycetota bacterium]|nr:NADH-quinone oxidoreductase subunit C [Actinomycetota bacterium]
MSEANAVRASASHEQPAQGGNGVRGREAPDESADDAMLYDCPRTDSRGQSVIHPSRETYVATMKSLLDDGYTMCVDLTAVDYSEADGRELPDGIGPERFEVVVNVLDMSAARRLRLRVQVPAGNAEVPSLFDLHPGTEAMEREVFDMFGISFPGHPDLTRILMPEDWEGHPLRKDYAIGEIPVQFKAVGER